MKRPQYISRHPLTTYDFINSSELEQYTNGKGKAINNSRHHAIDVRTWRLDVVQWQFSTAEIFAEASTEDLLMLGFQLSLRIAASGC
ncbi:hypothetical protein CDAR_228941 [Caerostris darwini]|uniref:Uncharacterized protein n=1 Tax=Caerostris darwini TaxID=1538125 RepID=A0AAV4S7Y5_9ARAC|nr:hypothetical protein CDAR_228941 [Caerostris darwini]